MKNGRARKCSAFVMGFGALVGAIVVPSVADATTSVSSDRIAGSDRYETAIAFANATTNCDGCAPDPAPPVLASGENYADALSAANMPHRPVLLTGRDKLPASTKAYLQRYAKASTAPYVSIVGGTASVSAAVEQEVRALDLPVYRFGGRDRYETARESIPRGNSRAVLLASGEEFPDALAVGPVIGELGMLGYVLLLTPRAHLPAVVRTYLDGQPTMGVTIIGGVDAVSSQVESELGSHYQGRIAGADRYETAGKLADHLAQWRQLTGQPAINRVFIASGATFPDALSASPVVEQSGGAILLGGPTDLPSTTRDWLKAHAADINRVTAVGGQLAVPDKELEQAAAAATR